MKWDQTLSDRLREMWKHHSSGEIVAMLHSEGYAVTRSAVMGRVSRMKLPFGKSHTCEVSRALSRRSPRPRIPRIPQNKPANGERKTLLDLDPGDCRWPVGEEGDTYTFCGCPKDGDLPYCAAHWRQSRIPGRPLRRDQRW